MMNGDFRRNIRATDGGFVSLVTGPATALISAVEAREHCEIEGDVTDFDAVLADCISTATSYLDAEHGILGRALITQTWRLTLNAVPSGRFLSLPFPPVQSVTNVKYYDQDGAEQTLATNNYRLISAPDGAFIELKSTGTWPSVDDRSGAFWVDYVAGYGDAATDVPAPVVNAAKMMVSHLFENREAVQDSATFETNMGFKALISSFRVSRF